MKICNMVLRALTLTRREGSRANWACKKYIFHLISKNTKTPINTSQLKKRFCFLILQILFLLLLFVSFNNCTNCFCFFKKICFFCFWKCFCFDSKLHTHFCCFGFLSRSVCFLCLLLHFSSVYLFKKSSNFCIILYKSSLIECRDLFATISVCYSCCCFLSSSNL